MAVRSSHCIEISQNNSCVMCQNVVDALSCWHQLFCQVWYKLAVDCMKNSNKCPNIPNSAMVKKMKK